MAYIKTIEEDQATGDVAAMYAAAREGMGYLPNFSKAFSLRPELESVWEALLTSIRSKMEPRRYEIATLGAARAIGSSYCMLAHGSVLMGLGITSDELSSLGQGRTDHLSAEEAAVFSYAGKVARDAGSVRENDIDELRAHGLSDAEIFDVAAAAAVRCFFSKLLDAVGVEPDAKYRSLDANLRDALTVGRAIEEA